MSDLFILKKKTRAKDWTPWGLWWKVLLFGESETYVDLGAELVMQSMAGTKTLHWYQLRGFPIYGQEVFLVMLSAFLFAWLDQTEG